MRILPALATALAGAVALAAVTASAAPKVVASIAPVDWLVRGVMEGVAEPTLLVSGAGSPHDHQLRPSEVRALADADAVFWIGPGLEAFLAQRIATLAPRARSVPLMEAAGMTLLEAREGGDWEKHEHSHGHGGKHGHGHSHGAKDDDEPHDAHVWMDPRNARAMVVAIAAALAETDPANAARYRANGTALEERLEAFDGELAARLAPVAGRPYVVFHDAYQYLERRYGLGAVGSVTVSPERPPGAKRLTQLREKMRRLGALCLFAEPQYEAKLLRTVAEGLKVRHGTLDPLEGGTDRGAEAYFRLQRRNAEALVACLGGTA